MSEQQRPFEYGAATEPRSRLGLARGVAALLVVLGAALGGHVASASAERDGATSQRSEGDARHAGGAAETLARLEFMIGEWDQRGIMSSETFGDSAGAYEGPCSCRWGPFRAWVECDFSSSALAGLGAYAVHVVIQHDAETDGYRSFVINNYGDSTYTGQWDDDSSLVFRARHGDEIQRVRYTPQEDGRVKFYVDQSGDGGRTWAAHTDAFWYRDSR